MVIRSFSTDFSTEKSAKIALKLTLEGLKYPNTCELKIKDMCGPSKVSLALFWPFLANGAIYENRQSEITF